MFWGEVMRYCVLYPNSRNVNLVKEMGIMPYKLHKLFGYDAWLACYRLGEYDYLKDEVKGLNIDFIDNKFNNYTLDGIKYIKQNGNKIDILQIFHITLYSFFYALVYKNINPNGKIYLKLDCSHKLIDKIKSLDFIRKKFLKIYLDKVDIISVEQKRLHNQLIELLPKYKNKIINIPNGVDFEYLERKNIHYEYSKKENIILNVARLGAEEKNTRMLLEAFAKINEVENSVWKLVLVGSIEKEFDVYIDKYFKDNPHLKDKVIFKGEISDRKKLFEEYKKAKIFCLTSDFESFAFALIEAASLGDVIVSTDVGIVREIIIDDNGEIVEKNNIEDLSNKLKKLMHNKKLEEKSITTYNLCRKNFSWNNIITELDKNLKCLEKTRNYI